MKYKVISLCDGMFFTCEQCKMSKTSCLKQLSSLVKENDYIVIDIGKIKSMNSTLLSSVLEFKDNIVICNPTPISINIFSILGVDKFIKVFNSIEDSVQYLEKQYDKSTVSYR